MKRNLCEILLTAVLLLLGSSPAWAVIDEIIVPNPLGLARTFRPNEIVPVPQRKQIIMEIRGVGTDLAVDVDVSGAGVKGTIGDRKHGNGSSVEIGFDINDNASAGVRTVTIKYPLGQDTFKIKVVRVGTVSKIEYEQPFFPTANSNADNFGRSGGAGSSVGSLRTSTRLVPAQNVPQDEKITLLLTGTKLDDVRVIPDSYDNYTARVLPGSTETRCRIEIEFSQGGKHQIRLYSTETKKVGAFTFAYEGTPRNSLEVTAARSTSAGNTGGGSTGNVIGIGGSSQQPATFIDVAPRANMLNTFRRLSNFAPFSQNGLTMVRVEDRFCSGIPVNQNDFRDITVPNPVWGVTNIGTQDVSTNFSVRLASRGQTLQEETILDLNTGQTKDFTYRRPGNSRVRVRTFSDRQGCYASPDDSEFFEDPEFTVLIDTNRVLNEAAGNQNNNERRY